MGCCCSAQTESYDSLKASLVESTNPEARNSGELITQTRTETLTSGNKDITLTGIYHLSPEGSGSSNSELGADALQSEIDQDKRSAGILETSMTVDDIGTNVLVSQCIYFARLNCVPYQMRGY
jgi:hypothetical protein